MAETRSDHLAQGMELASDCVSLLQHLGQLHLGVVAMEAIEVSEIVTDVPAHFVMKDQAGQTTDSTFGVIESWGQLGYFRSEFLIELRVALGLLLAVRVSSTQGGPLAAVVRHLDPSVVLICNSCVQVQKVRGLELIAAVLERTTAGCCPSDPFTSERVPIVDEN
ncbi:hypothetical protein [Streptomyces chartreusis]|uniref:hypothetical protein n=1 Tax=Streptomyces chartreusis TaxID=1969 RepID=UPI002E810C52|nr:hypothetical protein [Streptomyces chartreusis]WUB19504.1 hypothetical protein OG997_23615 [Streptomyces chartreusis]